MKRSRIVPGEAIAAIAAILLLAFMFTDWYGSEVSGQVGAISLGGGAGEGGNAWQTLDVISIILILTVLLTLGSVALRAFGSSWEPAIPPSAAIAILGGLSTLLVLFRIFVPPDFGDFGGVSVNATLELGVFLGLGASVAVAYGGYRAMGERGTSFEQIAHLLSRDTSKEGKDAGSSPQRTH